MFKKFTRRRGRGQKRFWGKRKSRRDQGARRGKSRRRSRKTFRGKRGTRSSPAAGGEKEKKKKNDLVDDYEFMAIANEGAAGWPSYWTGDPGYDELKADIEKGKRVTEKDLHSYFEKAKDHFRKEKEQGKDIDRILN